MITFSMVDILRIQAVMASLKGLPAAIKRSKRAGVHAIPKENYSGECDLAI
jgi:hypothetical protein